jgi:hypothetical protein
MSAGDTFLLSKGQQDTRDAQRIKDRLHDQRIHIFFYLQEYGPVNKEGGDNVVVSYYSRVLASH